MEGKVQIYTGNDKEKTAATLGLAVRSLYTDKKVVIDQLIKGMTYSELKLSDYFENLSLEQFGWNCPAYRKPADEDCEKVADGLARMKVYLEDESIDLLILDEINVACGYKLIDPKEIVNLFRKRSKTIEVALTGRYTPQEFVDFTDLVTEMKGVKHYYKKGLKVRLGIKY